MAYIEEEIDSRLPYRIGCPILPVLPVETKTPSIAFETYLPNFANHKQVIQDVLAEHGIPFRGLSFVYRLHEGVDLADRYLTLVLQSNYKDGCQGEWVEAVKAIRKHLVQSDISWAIELIDEQVFSNKLPVAPVLTEDREFIEGWCRAYANVLHIIKDRDVISIDPLKRRFPAGDTHPAIIISARDANDEIWRKETIPAIRQQLQVDNLEAEIVLLQGGGLWF